jgi:hypothetical protein
MAVPDARHPLIPGHSLVVHCLLPWRWRSFLGQVTRVSGDGLWWVGLVLSLSTVALLLWLFRE